MAGHHNLQGTEQVKGSCAALKQSLGIAGMNIGWKNSNQAMNYRRRGFSLALGSFRNMVHTISDCWGRTAITVFMTQTHTKKTLLVFWSWTKPKDCLGNGSHSLQEEHEVQIPHGPSSVPIVWSWVMLGFPPSDFLRKLWAHCKGPSCGIPRKFG